MLLLANTSINSMNSACSFGHLFYNRILTIFLMRFQESNELVACVFFFLFIKSPPTDSFSCSLNPLQLLPSNRDVVSVVSLRICRRTELELCSRGLISCFNSDVAKKKVIEKKWFTGCVKVLCNCIFITNSVCPEHFHTKIFNSRFILRTSQSLSE